MTVSYPASAAPAASFNYSCYGYTGTFKSGSHILKPDWDQNGTTDECFGIAPDRTIWHAWRNSGGWKVMPNNGRADDTSGYGVLAGRRYVEVYVASPSSFYCSTLTTSWQPWVRC